MTLVLGRTTVAGLASFGASLAAAAYLSLGAPSAALHRDPRLEAVAVLLCLWQALSWAYPSRDVIRHRLLRSIARWTLYTAVGLHLWATAVYGWAVGGYFVLSALLGVAAAVFARRESSLPE